jgi:thiosulfate/3-mercaptopyruvate sulfurtransferase
MKTRTVEPAEFGWIGRGTGLFLPLFIMIAVALASPGVCHGGELKRMDVQTLSQNRSDWIILDARPMAVWEKAHIPGAHSFSWESYTRTDAQKIPYRVQEPDILAKALGSLGVSVDTPVAVYGDADTSWGGEGWTCWTLAWLGHQGPIAIVDGGVQAWIGAGFALISGRESPTRAEVVYRTRPISTMMVSAQGLHQRSGAVQMVDTRSTLEWFRGRIPGAVHIPWEDFFTGRSRQPLDRESVLALFTKHGITLDKPVIYYCTGGIRSAYAWMVHGLAGLPGALNFEGGFEEWKVVYP